MELYRFGLIDALSSIAAGKFSASDYVESCIDRTIAVEPAVGAFAHWDAEAVRAALSAMPSHGALAGMPIGVKDIIATRHVPTEMGSAAFLGHVPEHSAWVVDVLAGAASIMFGKTVTTEFAWRHPGKTRNPWNLNHTPGGSSSGSAAAVACGCVPAALGTQTLGSVIRPAAFCGVVGYKPSFGTIPRTGVYALAPSLDHIGVFTRSVVDAAFLVSTLTGRDGVDFRNTPSPSPVWPLAQPKERLQIALLRTSAWQRLSIEQQQLVESTARHLEACGAVITPIALPSSFEDAWRIAQTLCEAEGAVINGTLARETPPRISPPSLALVARGEALSAVDYIRAKDAQQALVREFAALMEPFDAALTAPALGEAPTGLESTGDALFCIPFTLVGAPAISLPAGESKNKLPMGVQLIGRWGDDRRLLEAAVWVERQIAWPQNFPLDQQQ
ncbi:MAG TPA: amidase [Polaromonas sp.]|uniref:amidase n=1 Tax=Polaromonas sp. UBA4122 TaxID=1947074 RepID=UPI000ECF81A3|nr:amidase [Polaromonas sp. UBA4122]HAL38275.1 amidase [Polaromonas sp.]